MVREIRQLSIRIARLVTSVLAHAVLRCFTGKARPLFIEQIIAAAFVLNQSTWFNAFLRFVTKSQLSREQYELLFRHSCELLDAKNIPAPLIEAFEKASGGSLHYSQEGEDIMLERLLGSKRNGFFVDIGAHHATRFSNTYALYRKGWRGINIDATPGSMSSFEQLRPYDINLEIAISDKNEPLVFSMFKESALNTFDRVLAQSYIAGGWELKGTVALVPRTLSEVFEEYLKEDQKIDLLSIDVEGEELGVLRSNNWHRYCPDIIVIEMLDTELTSLHMHPTMVFLADKGYMPISRLYNSIILQRAARNRGIR